MKKELLTVEFRYCDAPQWASDCEYHHKKIAIGIFDTLEEAVQKGNDVIKELSKYFEVRYNDKFSLNGGIAGAPQRLVSNCCYPTNGVAYYATLTTLDFADITATIQNTFEATSRYRKYIEEMGE